MPVRVSSKFQVIIPKALRESAGITPGQKVEVFHRSGVIEVVPVPDGQQSQGLLKGVTNTFQRDTDR